MFNLNKFYRNFCFTHNNYSESDIQRYLDYPFQYLVFAKEVGDSGTPHLQGYAELTGQSRGKTLIKLFPGAHLMALTATKEDAINYIKDPQQTKAGREHNKQKPAEDELYELGERKHSGTRNDIEIARELLHSRQQINPNEHTIGTIRAYEKLQKYCTSAGNRSKPRVEWYYGEGGSGKTKRAYALGTGTTIYKCDLLDVGWMEGYNFHETVIIDDYNPVRNDEKAFKTLLQMLHEYPFQMNVKNSSVWFVPKTIVITSQNPPWFYFSNDPNICMKSEEGLLETFKTDVWLRQLMRRIDWVERLETPADELVFPILINVNTTRT